MAFRFSKKTLPTVTCPRCGARATYIEAKPCCGVCGWNLDRIRHYLAKSVAQSAVAAASFAAVYLLTDLPSWFIPLIMAFVFVASLSGIARGFLAIRKLHPSAPRPANLDLPFTQLTAASLARPDWKKGIAGRVAVTLFGVACWVFWIRPFALAFLHKAAHPASWSVVEWVAVLVHVVVLALAVRSWWRTLRTLRLELRITRQAAVATGRILKQEFRITGGSEVTYEFRDPSGAIRHGTAEDGSHTLFEEMAIPIAYRWDDPGANLPLAAFALYRLKQPTQAVTG